MIHYAYTKFFLIIDFCFDLIEDSTCYSRFLTKDYQGQSTSNKQKAFLAARRGTLFVQRQFWPNILGIFVLQDEIDIFGSTVSTHSNWDLTHGSWDYC